MLCDKRISLLNYVQGEDGVWRWKEGRKLWANVERKSQKNNFSTMGVGASTTVFTLSPCGIQMGQAIGFHGHHHHLTGIEQLDSTMVKVTTADVEPAVFTASRWPSGKGQLGYQGEPQRICEFSGVLVPKWAGYKQEDPYSEVTVTAVLVTPKAIKLKCNDVITTEDGDKYEVHLIDGHDLYKMEYELYNREEV